MTLLADSKKEAVHAYGVGKITGGISRMSFLINPEGKIAKVYDKVKPAEHADEVLGDLRQLQ